MTLNYFENDVEWKIVERGLNYYRSGDVKRLEKVGENEFSAVVFGSEKYSVFVKTNGEADPFPKNWTGKKLVEKSLLEVEF